MKFEEISLELGEERNLLYRDHYDKDDEEEKE